MAQVKLKILSGERDQNSSSLWATISKIYPSATVFEFRPLYRVSIRVKYGSLGGLGVLPYP